MELDDTEHIHPGLRVRSYLGGDVPSLLQAQLSPVFACRLIALRPLEAAGPTTRIRMQNSRRAAFSACPRAPRRPMEWSVEGFLRLAIEEAASLPDRQRVSDRYWVALSTGRSDLPSAGTIGKLLGAVGASERRFWAQAHRHGARLQAIRSVQAGEREHSNRVGGRGEEPAENGGDVLRSRRRQVKAILRLRGCQERRYVPAGLLVARLRVPARDDVCGLPVSVEQAALVADAYRKLPRRSRYVLTVRLGLGVGVRSCREVAMPLGLSAERVVQLRGRALDVLRRAGCGGMKVSPAFSEGSVISLLRRLAR